MSNTLSVTIPTIRKAYETWDKESLQAGETDDKGWASEEVDMTVQSYEEEQSLIMKTVAYLLSEGAQTYSSNNFASHGCYITSDPDIDYQSGESTNSSWHLTGYNESDLKSIYDEFEKRINL